MQFRITFKTMRKLVSKTVGVTMDTCRATAQVLNISLLTKKNGDRISISNPGKGKPPALGKKRDNLGPLGRKGASHSIFKI